MVRHNGFLTTTTHSVEGAQVTQYLDVVYHSVVVGANILSDLVAAFTDFFGGFSRTYEKRLQLIFDEAINGLELKAKMTGANGVLGVSLDVDEISGGGKSMFMISVSGTAVILQWSAQHPPRNLESSSQSVTNKVLQHKVGRIHLERRLADDEALSKEDWKDVLRYGDHKLLDKVLARFIADYQNEFSDGQPKNEILYDFMISYLSSLPHEKVIAVVYSHIVDHAELIADLIIDADLFDPFSIHSLLNTGRTNEAIVVLESTKNIYTREDFASMVEIRNWLKGMEDVGELKVAKGVLGKEKLRYVCVNNHSNPSKAKYCQVCDLNIKGLTREQVKKIESFFVRVDVLESIYE